MNMRENETSEMLAKFNLDDAYLQGEQNKTEKHTWDSKINKYREEAFQFVCRFDRVFLRKFTPLNFKLIGNRPVSENPGHFLSDHFGIVVEIIAK